MNPEQISALKAPLNRAHVKERSQSGRVLSYIEGWKAIEEANRIFGFDGWSSQTVDVKCVAERERKLSNGGDGWAVSYIAKVIIRVFDNSGTIEGYITREGIGAGHGIDRDLGLAHESAIKEAETDARKRGLMTFGNPFGLALYDKTQANVATTTPEPRGGTASGPAQAGGGGSDLKRLSSARAKELNLGDQISAAIWGCKTLTELAEWYAEFEKHTAQVPLSWLDAIRNDVILRKEAIPGEIANGEMDRQFAATVG